MKRKFFSGFVILYVLLSPVVLGQATFQLNNHALRLGVDAPVFDAQGVPLEGLIYRAELYGGNKSESLSPASASLASPSSRLMVPFLEGVAAGYFGTSESAVIFQVPPGGSAWLQVKAWDTRLGATYEEVAAIGLGGYGESPLFYAAGGNPGPNPTPPGPLIGLQSFNLLPVIPEPSPVLLLLPGLAWFFWCCRRPK